MKIRLGLLLLLFLVFAWPIRAEKLTLEQALREVLQRNPEIKARTYEVSAGKAAWQAEKASGRPQIGVLARATRFGDPQAVTAIKGPGRFPAFSRDIYLWEVRLVWPLYEGGRRQQRVDMAAWGSRASKEFRQKIALDLLAEVEELYYQGLYLQELLQIQKKILEALRQVAKEAEWRLSLGKIAPVERMRIETQVRAQEANLASTREALQRTREALNVLRGRPPDTPLEFVGQLSLPEERKWSPRWEEILDCRPDLLAQRARVRQAEAAWKLARRARYPSLELISSYGRHAGSGFHDNEEVWEAGVQVRLDIFQGGRISAREAEARARWLAEKERLRALELAARQEVYQALSRLQEARQRLRYLASARETARETFRVEELRYRAGAGNLTDLLLAQAAWLSSEAGYLEALYAYHQARILYRKATTEIARGWLSLSCEEYTHEKGS